MADCEGVECDVLLASKTILTAKKRVVNVLNSRWTFSAFKIMTKMEKKYSIKQLKMAS